MLLKADIGRSAVRALAQLEDPYLTDMVLWLNTLDDAMMSERVASLVKRSAQESVAHMSCELALRLKNVGLTTSNSLPMP